MTAVEVSEPAVAGFHPDPTICRVGDTYYLANSSFEYRPGVPLRVSTDLLHWDLVGHAFTRTSQLPDSEGLGSTGIFAPTLRHHDGVFYLVTTNVVGEAPEQVILRAESIAGPWSEPSVTQGAVGIDPDLCWDGDECYLTWCELGVGISQARIDPDTAQLQEEPRRLWSGTGLAHPEGPHIFKRGSWWYLVIAEGGTERGHSVSVARGVSPTGPFEGCPANPILSHRSRAVAVQNTGHADIFEKADGDWAITFLGTRPRGVSPGFHVNGRETFLAGIEWHDDWPVVIDPRHEIVATDHSFLDDFRGDRLHARWASPGVFPETFAETGAHGLRLASDVVRFVGARVQDLEWTSTATLAVSEGWGAFALRLDEAHMYAVEVEGERVVATSVIGEVRTEHGSIVIAPGQEVTVTIAAVPDHGQFLARPGPDTITLAVHTDEGEQVLARLDGRYLSTEVAGGFTGRMLGFAVRGEATVTTIACTAR